MASVKPCAKTAHVGAQNLSRSHHKVVTYLRATRGVGMAAGAVAKMSSAQCLEQHPGIREKLTVLTKELATSQPPDPLAPLDAAIARVRTEKAQVACERYAKLRKHREAWESNRASFDAWLDQTPEDALEPDLEIVDPHHHLWDMREFAGANPWGLFKQQYYMTDELLKDCVGGGHNITHTVFVQTHSFFSADVGDPMMAPLGEVQAMQGVAAQFASGKYGSFRGVAGIVGSADLGKFGAAVEPLLVACKAASPNFRGIRCSGTHDPNLAAGSAPTHPHPGLYLEPTFREGFALLEKHGLVFDAWLFSSQLDDLYDLARAFPSTSIVLDHVGSPIATLGDEAAGASAYAGRAAELVDAWKVGMQRLATNCLNVYVKVGGSGFPLLGHGFEKRAQPPTSEEVAEVLGPSYLWTIETFGPARCMLESNFPVDKVSMSYTVLWNALKRITKAAGLSDADRALLFSGTAKRVYGLGA